jgi:hypothetical protein
MIIYNVTINVEDDIHHEWLEWMRNVHIPEVLSTGLFHGHRLCKLLDVEDEGATYSVQYSAKSLEDYNKYKTEHAPKLQQEMLGKFGNKTLAFRTLLEVIE